MSEVVPFGKYKGQSVEAMVQDRQYVEWLTAQPWFRDRYQAIYNVVINNFQEPADTPEHNALQVLFLDENFRKRFMKVIYKTDYGETNVKFEQDGFDVYLLGYYGWKEEHGGHWSRSESCHVEVKPSIGDDYPAVLRQMKAASVPRRDRVWGAESVNRMVLFLERYVGLGANEEQFIAFFESAHIDVVFLDEV